MWPFKKNSAEQAEPEISSEQEKIEEKVEETPIQREKRLMGEQFCFPKNLDTLYPDDISKNDVLKVLNSRETEDSIITVAFHRQGGFTYSYRAYYTIALKGVEIVLNVDSIGLKDVIDVIFEGIGSWRKTTKKHYKHVLYVVDYVNHWARHINKLKEEEDILKMERLLSSVECDGSKSDVPISVTDIKRLKESEEDKKYSEYWYSALNDFSFPDRFTKVPMKTELYRLIDLIESLRVGEHIELTKSKNMGGEFSKKVRTFLNFEVTVISNADNSKFRTSITVDDRVVIDQNIYVDKSFDPYITYLVNYLSERVSLMLETERNKTLDALRSVGKQ